MSIVQLKRVVRGGGENGNQNLHKYNKATRAKSAKEMLTAKGTQATQAREKQSAVPLTTAIKITNQLSGAGGALLRRVEWGKGEAALVAGQLRKTTKNEFIFTANS